MDRNHAGRTGRQLTPEEKRRIISRMSPEQRRRLLKKRRMRRLKKRLMIAVPVFILLVVLLVLLLSGGEDRQADAGVQQAVPAIAAASTELSGEAGQAEASLTADVPTMPNAGVESNADAANTGLADAGTLDAGTADAGIADAGAVEAGASDASLDDTNVPSVGMSDAGAVDAGVPSANAAVGGVAREPDPVASDVAVEHFNYDEAYAKMLRGELANDGRMVSEDLSKVAESKKSAWPEAQAGYLPVLRSAANTQEKIIAITVDDCFQGENLRKIVQSALNNNGKLTIFPIGKNLEKSSVAETVKWAWESGMEIENHTYNHVGLFHYDDERMTNEIWQQNRKVSELLGVDYQMHFFRPRGGDERGDQRVHAYADQLGYNGIAMWNKDGSNGSINGLLNNLAPGNIYLFHTTNNDLNLLLDFIPGAVAQGYRLVTLNEMFGLPSNETQPLSQNASVPALEKFQMKAITLSNTTYARAAAVVQQRLIELGWLDGEADGEFGKASYRATGFFQMAAGIDADGVAGESTQRALFSDDAPKGSVEKMNELRKQIASKS